MCGEGVAEDMAQEGGVVWFGCIELLMSSKEICCMDRMWCVSVDRIEAFAGEWQVFRQGEEVNFIEQLYMTRINIGFSNI